MNIGICNPLGGCREAAALSFARLCSQVKCYRELFRVLKPGGCFAGYEWCMTASFDADNAEHRRIKVRQRRCIGSPTCSRLGS